MEGWLRVGKGPYQAPDSVCVQLTRVAQGHGWACECVSPACLVLVS